MKIDIHTLTEGELVDFMEQNGEKKYRGKQVFNWIWNKNVSSFDEMQNIPKILREKLINAFKINGIKPVATQKSTDGTIKTAFELHDKKLIEGVLIPSKDRTTACISTQVGCALQCKFCATSSIKLKRNLTAAEIYQQVACLNKQSIKEFDKPLSNIVVMGMGEPLLNYNNTMLAINYITKENIMGMSPRRITVSTVGIAPQIKQLANDAPSIHLAISLHTANDNKRNHLIPINKKYSIQEISNALQYYHQKTKNRITIEYLMLKNFNDTIDDARELARFCRAFPCKVNLIMYNNVEEGKFEKTSDNKRTDFAAFLESKNMVVNIRKSKGEDIDAACGQLANKNKKQ